MEVAAVVIAYDAWTCRESREEQIVNCSSAFTVFHGVKTNQFSMFETKSHEEAGCAFATGANKLVTCAEGFRVSIFLV